MIIKTIEPQIPNIEKISKEIRKCFKRKYLTNDGKNLLKFQLKLQTYFNSKLKPLVFCNGEMALYTLVQAWKFHLKLKKCKALVPSFTFSGTVNALVQNNVEPVFCDINQTLTMDLEKVKLTKDIKFIVAASVYGNIPDIEKIKTFAKKNKLIFILDNAPGICSKIKDKYPINHGVDEIYSFHATKIFNSIEGGCALTNNNSIHKIMTAARNFGQLKKGDNNVIIPGLNSKMNELSAIVGLENLKNLRKLSSSRKKIISRYIQFFSKLEKKKFLSNMKVSKNVFCNYFFFPIILNKNYVEKFLSHMKKNKIYCRRYYKSVHTTNYYKKRVKKKDIQLLPYTEKIKNKVVALPIHSFMNSSEIEYLFRCVENFFKNIRN